METALLVVLGLILASIWTVSGLFVLFIVRLEARIREGLADSLRAIVESPTEGQPSPLAVYSDQVATLFAARVVQQVKTAVGGVASGAAKEAQAEGMAQIAGASPWLAVLANLLPRKFRNSLLSNPQFTGQLSMFGNSGGGNGHAETGSVLERLKHQR